MPASHGKAVCHEKRRLNVNRLVYALVNFETTYPVGSRLPLAMFYCIGPDWSFDGSTSQCRIFFRCQV